MPERPLVLLDENHLAMATIPNAEIRGPIQKWIASLVEAGIDVKVPSIADYELRRELIRSAKTESVKRLDDFVAAFGYIECSREALKHASEQWAHARNTYRKPTPGVKDERLDADMIICGHVLAQSGRCIVATNNVKDFEQHVEARRWQDIDKSDFGL